MASWPAKISVFGVWPMAMKSPVTSMSRVRAVRQRAQAHARDALLIAQHFVDRVIPDQRDLAGCDSREQPVLQDLLRAQLVAPVNQRDVRGDVREIQRFFDRGVAAADDGHALVAEEESVAGGAGRDAPAAEFLLGRQAEILRASRRWR